LDKKKQSGRGIQLSVPQKRPGRSSAAQPTRRLVAPLIKKTLSKAEQAIPFEDEKFEDF
jgi:hypothetical protein